jgi:23S rRNA (cytidine1920-2'-O)/16S rRNA (cytidine1409-2'-O)-methyltransferase
MSKQRLDQYVHALGLSESREQARRLIMAGRVLVDGQMVDRPAAPVPEGARVEIKARPRFVSRGGEKLEAALDHFKIDVSGLICADVGASTGGFTDCLLQRGAARVYAIDVGRGLLEHRLRADPRVVVLEETNARYLERLPEPAQFASIDASFISLRLLLPVVKEWLASPPSPARSATPPPSPRPLAGEWEEGGEVVALVKPQFEAGRKDVGKGGVVRNSDVHRRVLAEVLAFAQSIGLTARGLIRSPLVGPKGNVEFLAWLRPGAEKTDVTPMIDAALAERVGVFQPANWAVFLAIGLAAQAVIAQVAHLG